MKTCFTAVLLLAGMAATAATSLAGPLPLWNPGGENIRAPLPAGIGIAFYRQDQDYSLDRWEASSPIPQVNAMVAQLGASLGEPDVENTTTMGSVKLDAWVLPFLNVFGILGYIETDTRIQLPPPLPRIETDPSGLVYGAGATLAAGWKDLFASLTGIYTDTDLEGKDTTVHAWIFQPRVGFDFEGPGANARIRFWAGAMYQNVTEEHEGSIAIPGFGWVDYQARLEDESPWNALAGTSICIGRHFDLSLEGGFGNRQNVQVAATYRF